ncbi:RNA polymerase sigma factor [uncultured Chitinophaga sp.]|uniref:RNA polymerase sigma factor n=1 Tax=uncultured Chitinophaga sp. TaxID=339340 RepID=UPI0025FF3A12|nr:RNA polymerase sigma-70 factor [uncultured Chitinophaga sp.]
MKYSGSEEEELVNLFTAGSEAAFAELYRRYHAGVYTYLLRFVKVPALAEDLVHDVFVKLWELRERVQITSSFSAYLYRACRNHAINRLKQIASDRELREQVMVHLAPLVPEAAVSPLKMQQYERLMKHAIDQLPPQRRKVFLLCREEGKTYNEAAEILGLSRNTVKEHMVYAMRFLKVYLFEHGDIVLFFLLFANVK